MSVIRATDRLFFAAIPDQATAARIAEVREDLCEACGLTGKPVAREQLHVTLWHVGDSLLAPSADLIDKLADRASRIEMPPFQVAFDHAMSFNQGAVVLCGEDGVEGLKMTHEQLKARLLVKGMKRRSGFTPHMTLLRDKRLVLKHRITPITWQVTELVLVHSLLGQTTHRYVRRIPLRRR
jgi:2'-5' RNA ligase